MNEGDCSASPGLTVRIPERGRTGAQTSSGSKASTPRGMAATPKASGNKTTALAGRARPTNNQLLLPTPAKLVSATAHAWLT
eukprot:722488-Prorocentrum_minimum.AAC.3